MVEPSPTSRLIARCGSHNSHGSHDSKGSASHVSWAATTMDESRQVFGDTPRKARNQMGAHSHAVSGCLCHRLRPAGWLGSRHEGLGMKKMSWRPSSLVPTPTLFYKSPLSS